MRIYKYEIEMRSLVQERKRKIMCSLVQERTIKIGNKMDDNTSTLFPIFLSFLHLFTTVNDIILIFHVLICQNNILD